MGKRTDTTTVTIEVEGNAGKIIDYYLDLITKRMIKEGCKIIDKKIKKRSDKFAEGFIIGTYGSIELHVSVVINGNKKKEKEDYKDFNSRLKLIKSEF